jgi:hypothetical protein
LLIFANSRKGAQDGGQNNDKNGQNAVFHDRIPFLGISEIHRQKMLQMQKQEDAQNEIVIYIEWAKNAYLA